MVDKCFCGRDAFFSTKIPIFGFTESGKVVDIYKGSKEQPTFKANLCPYHSSFSEKGLLISDGKMIFTPHHFRFDFERWTDEEIKEYAQEFDGSEEMTAYKLILEAILEGRKRELINPALSEEKFQQNIKSIISKYNPFSKKKKDL